MDLPLCSDRFSGRIDPLKLRVLYRPPGRFANSDPSSQAFLLMELSNFLLLFVAWHCFLKWVGSCEKEQAIKPKFSCFASFHFPFNLIRHAFARQIV
jgi:hypothetical protein